MRILEVSDVTVDFGGNRAVDNVSLPVEEGSLTGLIGPNGAGKTTLFNVISGLLPPSSGKVTIRKRHHSPQTASACSAGLGAHFPETGAVYFSVGSREHSSGWRDTQPLGFRRSNGRCG